MKQSIEGKRLRVILWEMDHYHHRSLCDVIVLTAKEMGLVGATVLRAIQGFGATDTTIHTSKILRLSNNLPVIIEIVDHVSRIDTFLPVVEGLIEEAGCGGTITIEKIEMIPIYKEGMVVARQEI